MVSGADYALLERLLSQPPVEGHNLLQIESGIHKVTSVDQNVSLRKTPNSVVETMSVGNRNQAHSMILIQILNVAAVKPRYQPSRSDLQHWLFPTNNSPHLIGSMPPCTQ
jgi:hypothetical protein